MVTIFLPTVDRPHLLRTALVSLAAQTAIGAITRVIVSENSGGRHSEALCREFSASLPIEYRAQTRQLSPIDHLVSLKAPPDGFVAILHDDDWWAPGHLAASLDRMARHPDAAVTYSGLFYAEAESSPLQCDSNLMFWFGAQFPVLTAEWRLSVAEVLMSCVWGTPGHFCAFLARAEAYRRAAFVYELGNPWDVDRLLTMELVRSGPLVFAPTPEVFIRRHASQGTHTFSFPERHAHLRATTERLIAHAREISLDLSAGVAQRLSTVPPSSRASLLDALIQPWSLEPLAAHGLAFPEVVAHATALAPKPKNLRYKIGRLLPPVLLEALARRSGR